MPSGAVRHNLPSRLTPLVGRASDVARVQTMLMTERLITLIGSGGVGKSSLALRVAGDVVERFDGGVWWVDLASLLPGAPIDAAVLAAVGGMDTPGRESRDAIAGLIGARASLVVLDNCEHVVDGAAELTGSLLGRCLELRVLATTQEPLRIDGEVVSRVPSLPIDDAVELLFDRADRARPGFGRDEPTVAALRRIGARLDGIPLALELAANRLRMVSAVQLADELDRRLMVLDGGARTGLPRHRTLRASIEWSHSLLSDDERRVLRRLAVFIGPFPLDAAEAVGAAGDDDSEGVFGVIAQLVDRSLVTVDEVNGMAWYRLLESVRAYATEQLDAANEGPRARQALAQWVARWTTTHLGASNHTDAWLADVRRLTPTVRAALDWALDDDVLTAATILTHTTRLVWTTDDAVEIGDRVLRELASIDERAWACCVASLAEARLFAGDFRFLDDVVPRALVIAERYDDRTVMTRCRLARLWLRSFDAEPFVEIVELARKANARYEFRVALGLAAVAAAMRNARRGRELLELWRTSASATDGRTAIAGECQVAAMVELLTSADLERHGDWTTRAFGLIDATVPPVQRTFVLGLHAEGALYRADHVTLAHVARRADQLDLDWGPHASRVAVLRHLLDVAHGGSLSTVDAAVAATGLVVSAVGIILLSFDTGDASLLDGAVAALPGDVGPLRPLARGMAAWLRGEAAADDSLRQALDADRVLMSALALVLLADRARQASSMTEAVRLVAAAEAQLDQIGFRWRPHPVADAIAAVHDEASDALGDHAHAVAIGDGRRLDLADAIEYCLRSHGVRQRPNHGWASLTPTERRVVALVVDGHTNAVIARRMLVSEATVKTHLVHVFRKLAVTSRAQLAAMAVTESRNATG